MLSGTSLDPSELRYVFKMVKQLSPAGNAQPNGQALDEYVGQGEFSVKAFDMSDVADFNVNNVILDKTQAKGQNGTAGFRTDTDISGHLAVRERNLQKFEFSEADTSLELGSGRSQAGTSSRPTTASRARRAPTMRAYTPPPSIEATLNMLGEQLALIESRVRSSPALRQTHMFAKSACRTTLLMTKAWTRRTSMIFAEAFALLD